MVKRDSVLAALGRNVRQAREKGELTQEKLAEFSGLDSTYISGIERGLRNPGIKNVARIAKALGLTMAERCKGVEASLGDGSTLEACRPRRRERGRFMLGLPRIAMPRGGTCHASSQRG